MAGEKPAVAAGAAGSQSLMLLAIDKPTHPGTTTAIQQALKVRVATAGMHAHANYYNHVLWYVCVAIDTHSTALSVSSCHQNRCNEGSTVALVLATAVDTDKVAGCLWCCKHSSRAEMAVHELCKVTSL